MQQENIILNSETSFNEVLQQHELLQALLNTCYVSDESKNILINLIQNASINNITFNNLNITSQELYKALLNTCNISNDSKQILCNILNNKSNSINFIDIPREELTMRLIINNSRTLNLTPKQVIELQNSSIMPVIIDTIELDDIFIKKSTMVSSIFFNVDDTLDNILYIGKSHTERYITYISDELDKPYTRTKMPGKEVLPGKTFRFSWEELWSMYNLQNNYVPLTIHIDNHGDYSITNMYKNENDEYIITITNTEDSDTRSYMCDRPTSYPTLIENNE